MTHRNRCKKAFVLWTLPILLGAADVAAVRGAQPPTNDPMRVIPADALFCIRINKLATSLGQVDQFLAGISPVGLSMPVQAQLGKLLGAPQPAGLNMTGDFAIFGPLPGGEKPDPKRVGMLIPISDFQQFLTNPNVVKPDAQGILKLNIDGKPSAAGIQMGSYLLLTRAADQQALLEAKNWTSGTGTASLAQRLSPDELKRATGSPAWAYANIQIAAKMYGPMLQQRIKEVTKKMQEAQAKGGPMLGSPAAAMDMWTSLLNSFMQEAQFVSLSIDPSATAIRLAPVVAGVPNSDMAKILSLSGTPQPQPNLTGYLENGAIMTGVASFSPAFVRAIALKEIDLITAMVGQAIPQEDIARLKKLATDSADVFGGATAWAFSSDPKSKPPFRARRVVTIRDRQKLNDVLDQAAKVMNQGAIADILKKSGLKMQFSLKRNVETYQGVPIDAASIMIEPIDVNSPQGQMMKSMFSGGFNGRMAVVNNLLLSAMAADPDKEIHALIDQAKSGSPGQIPSEVQAAMQLIPEAKNASFFGTYNYVRVIQMAMSFIPMPMPMPQVEVSTESDIAFAGTIGGGRLLTNIAVPKQQVQALANMFASMKQQEMQKQQKEPGQPGAQPRPAPGKAPAKKPGET
jgi:hypothetical protein